MSLRYSIDSAVYRDGLLYGWGWYLHDAAPAKSITLELRNNEGVLTTLRCGIDRTREDVAHAFPAVPHGTYAGIIFQGKIPKNFTGQASLKVELQNGEHLEHAIPGFPQLYSGESFEPRIVGGQLQRGWRHLRAGRWPHIFDRLRKYGGAGLQKIQTISRKKLSITNEGSLVLIIDHQLGGGANKFSQDKIAALQQQGHETALLTFNLPRLQYEVTYQNKGIVDRQTFLDLASAFELLLQSKISEIIVNDLVSYPEPGLILQWVTSIKSRQDCKLSFYLHDFFAVCPTWTLVNSAGVFCKIPAPEVCRQCLASMPVYFPSFIEEIDIENWRSPWLGFINACDQIVAFSQSSLDLFQKAFPDSPGLKNALVQPHQLTGNALARVEAKFDGTLVIAVIGNISVQKGARIIKEMTRQIMARKLDAKIVILGTLDEMEPSPCLEVLGPYQASHLPELLHKQRVGICLLPSICPETFSYATSEIMQMELPIAVFDLGAPAERVREYRYGAIIDTPTAEAALTAIFKLRDQLAERRIEHSGK